MHCPTFQGQGEEMLLKNRIPLLALFMAVLLAASLAPAQTSAAGGVDFSLRSIDGQTITSDSLRGEVVVLAFGASWLPLSKAQLAGVRKLADEYSNRGVVVYWVSTESEDAKSKNFASDEQLRAFAQQYGLKVTVLRDRMVRHRKRLVSTSASWKSQQGNASEPMAASIQRTLAGH